MRPVHRLLPAFAALCLVLAPPVSALTFAEMTYTCPIGGEVFTQRRPASGTGFGMELDMKPFGALIAPWPLPVCPGNGFVIYKDEEDFSAAERERLTAYVASDAYRTLVADDTPYYRAAMLMRAAGDDSVPAAVVLLRATWEAQADAQYTRYAEAALAAYRLEIAQEPAPAAPEWRPSPAACWSANCCAGSRASMRPNRNSPRCRPRLPGTSPPRPSIPWSR